MKRVLLIMFAGLIAASLLAALPALAQWTIGPTSVPPSGMPAFPQFVPFGTGAPEIGTTGNAGIWIEDTAGGDLLTLGRTLWGDPVLMVTGDARVGIQRQPTTPGLIAPLIDVGDVDTATEGDLNAERLCIAGDCLDMWAETLIGSGGVTPGTIVRWDASGQLLEDSAITEDGLSRIGVSNPVPGFDLDVGGQMRATALCIGGVCVNDWSAAGTDDQSLYNEIATSSGTTFAADPTDRLTFQQGSGILISAVDGGVDADAVSFDTESGVLQRRISDTCASGSGMQVIDVTGGAVTCVPVGEVTEDWNIVGSNLESAVSGSVGIGTAPSTTLHVAGVTRSAGYHFSDPSASHANGDGALYSIGSQSYLTVDDNITIRDSGGTNAFHFQTDTQTLTIGSGGGGKLNAATIDPVYTIGGSRFATYVAGMIGQKEEISGTVTLRGGKAVLDLRDAAEGSDLWLFSRIIDEELAGISVMLTPAFAGDVWYEKDRTAGIIRVKGDRDGLVSYRLTAPRLDAAELPTTLPFESGPAGIVIP